MKCKYIRDSRFNRVVIGDYVFTDGGSDMSRLIQTFKKGAMVVSACRGENSDEKNLELTKQLEEDLKRYNLGYRPSIGGFIENLGEADEKEVTELSFVVPYRSELMSEEEFMEIGVELCDLYGQDSVLIKLPSYNNGKPTYVNKYGDIDFDIDNNLTLDPRGEKYFTELKKGGSNKRFTLGPDLNDPNKPKKNPITLDSIVKDLSKFTYYVSPNSSKIRSYEGNGFMKK